MTKKEAEHLIDSKGARLYSATTLALLKYIVRKAIVRVKGGKIDYNANIERLIKGMRLDECKRTARSERTFYDALKLLRNDGVLRNWETTTYNRKRPTVQFTLCLDKLKEIPDSDLALKEKLRAKAAKARDTYQKEKDDDKKARKGLLWCLAGCCPKLQQPATAV